MHEQHYISAFKMFLDEPIFGIGTNMFRYNVIKQNTNIQKSHVVSPHQYFIQILAEQGIVGFYLLSFFRIL